MRIVLLRALAALRGMSSAAQEDLIARATPGEQRRLSVLTVSQVSRAWLYATIAMISIGALFGGAPLFVLGLLLAAALTVAWLWAHYALRNLIVERRFSQTRTRNLSRMARR